MKRLLLGVALAACAPAGARAVEAEVSPLVVMGQTPLGDPLSDPGAAAASTQTATGADIARSHAPDLSEFLRRELGGVYVNDIQNNPLQPDVSYRGYTASPLLGTAQGLSVYVDGVRLNQPFGDVVSWDLIPKSAIASLTLAPGANPLFGLNTLGGAIAIRSKDGRQNPGAAAELSYGQFGRLQGQAQFGGAFGRGFDLFATVEHFQEDGWRDASPSNADQAFAKLAWHDADTDLALSGSAADSDLTGNGLQDQRLLAADRSSIYTKPDETHNRAGLVNLVFDHRFSQGLSLTANAFHRQIRTRTLNGDLNDDALGENPYQPNAEEQAALAAAGYSGFPTAGESQADTPFPMWRCIANVLLDSEPNETCDGELNRTATHQRESGAAAELTWRTDANSLTAGASWLRSRAHFTQSTQYGYLTPDRGVAVVDGPGAFADGSQDSEDVTDARVDLMGRTRVYSLYATDTIRLRPQLRLTVSGRYDDNRVRDLDALTPSGGGSLSGAHRFHRLNPAASLTWTPSPALTLHGGYSEGARAPSAIELGCADPDNPCKLPNAMAGDPPLRQVVAHTAELGARGRLRGVAWDASLFRAENHDDILFVADDVSGFGYFRNFGRTRRQGVDLGLTGAVGPVSLSTHYTYLDATYRTAEMLPGEGNSSNDAGPGFEGEIAVRPGDRIPLVPRQIFKAAARWRVTSSFDLDADMAAVGGVYARGDENNQHRPDGLYDLGPGKTDAYAVFNLGAEWRPRTGLKLFVQADNLFDKRYATAAQLGSTGFDAAGAFVTRPFAGPVVDGERPMQGVTFFAPGAPRTVWAGVRYSFGPG